MNTMYIGSDIISGGDSCLAQPPMPQMLCSENVLIRNYRNFMMTPSEYISIREALSAKCSHSISILEDIGFYCEPKRIRKNPKETRNILRSLCYAP